MPPAAIRSEHVSIVDGIPQRTQPHDFDLIHPAPESIECAESVFKLNLARQNGAIDDELVVGVELQEIKKVFEEFLHPNPSKVDTLGASHAFKHGRSIVS
jgi:hypothetical protein